MKRLLNKIHLASRYFIPLCNIVYDILIVSVIKKICTKLFYIAKEMNHSLFFIREDNLSEKLHENGEYDLYVTFTPNDAGDKAVPGTVKCRQLILKNMPADSYIRE